MKRHSVPIDRRNPTNSFLSSIFTVMFFISLSEYYQPFRNCQAPRFRCNTGYGRQYRSYFWALSGPLPSAPFGRPLFYGFRITEGPEKSSLSGLFSNFLFSLSAAYYQVVFMCFSIKRPDCISYFFFVNFLQKGQCLALCPSFFNRRSSCRVPRPRIATCSLHPAPTAT